MASDATLAWTHYNSDGKRVFNKKSKFKINKDRWVHVALVYSEQPLTATIYIDSISSTIDDNSSVSSPSPINTQLAKKNVGVFQGNGP